MKIHEYQAKGLFARHGLAVPRGEVAFTPDEAAEVAERLRGRIVVKAQIHAGGRGKGGGVKVVDSRTEALHATKQIIGMNLVTAQTGPEGRRVTRVLVEEALDIDRELYLGLLIDRGLARPVMMVSAAGGMEIEQVARDTPELILRETIDPAVGLMGFQARRLAFGLGLSGPVVRNAVKLMRGVYTLFGEIDASLIEVNPLIVTTQGDVFALDAKVSLDDNALFRQAAHHELRDLSEEEELEVEASKYSLNYIRLDGSIGCMVNGAGLAMATMDIIELAGGDPGLKLGAANFLDVGGGANAEQIRNAFRILMSDGNVKAVLINIFGGILRCDVLAEGVIAAVQELHVQLPVVIRMEGTNVEQGKQMLRDSGLNFTTADTMDEAAKQVVARAAAVGEELQ